MTQLVEATPVFYNLSKTNNWQPDLKALEGLDTSKIKLMWLNYPHMPTGAKADRASLKQLIQWAAKEDILLINDGGQSGGRTAHIGYRR